MKMGEYNNTEYRGMEYNSTEERILTGREDYRRIPVPEEMRARLEEGIARAEAEMRMRAETEMTEREETEIISREETEMISREEAEMTSRKEAEMSARRDTEMPVCGETEMKVRGETEMTEQAETEMTVRGEAGQTAEDRVDRSGVKGERQRAQRKGGTKMSKRKKIGFRIAAAVAAAAALLVILPNTGADAAYAMGSIPVVGKLFQAVTFRDYQYESERFDADVEVPRIVVEDVEENEAAKNGTAEGETGTADSAAGEQRAEGSSDKLQETVEQINFDIEKVTNQLIEEFQASADLGESYGSLEIHHETVTDNENYFTLKLSMYQGAGSGYESYKFYTIDKRTRKQVQIGDLFREGSGYNEVLSENIKDQMRAEMAEDENKIYWVDYGDVPEWNWEGLKEDQNFYFDEAGNIVVVFDEYEVAPGYMGALEFTVERSVFEEILK